MKEIAEKIVRDLEKIRRERPLLHHITNFVVMNETANLTLCLGALPVMAHAPEEVEEMVRAAKVLVLNIGTLTPHWIESMLLAGLDAIVFDKTGTLTKGEPEVTDVIAADHDERKALLLAAIAEKGSEHPLGEAIVKGAVSRGIDVPDAEFFDAIPGHGVRAKYGGCEILLGNRRLLKDSIKWG